MSAARRAVTTVAEINIPVGPLSEAPWGAIRYALTEHSIGVFQAAIRAALGDLELGAYDERIVAWLAGWDTPTVATVCSWLHRVRAAAVEGRIVLDEPEELGVPWHDGQDLFALTSDGIVMFPGAADKYDVSPDEALEWAAQLAAMAYAQKAVQAGDAR